MTLNNLIVKLQLGVKVVSPDRVLSMGQIEQTTCANICLLLHCDCYIAILRPFNCVQKRAQAHLNVLSTKCVY